MIAARAREGQFTDEEVESSYTYPEGYQPGHPVYQIHHINELFPELCSAEFPGRALPPNAEGWFAIPKWEKIAPTYGKAVEKVLAIIASKRKFYNYRHGQLGSEYLRQHAKTVEMFQKLADEQKGVDILLVPAQFGLRHRGRSVRRTREVFDASEFGFGAFAVGIMLLTHPERLQHYDDLWIDCAGDEYDVPDNRGWFACSPFFSFDDGKLEFGTRWFGGAGVGCGSASGFIPPS